ncbi:restriction endonuclease subunit S [Lacinutrix himadriensis]|uniref:restriction endonuclease subunit S n=1 Tax=Lacinutrix himadriensis TaxID=641549 RepID=UPI0006E45B0D|nr:restriction endonuclease subunit S [Lacinutrix himadriensis]
MRIINESFLKVISDKTSKFTKIHKSKFLTNGEFPIVDQGQEYIAGYTNNKEDINYLGEPVIIFGDHTRILKYVDFPFAIGADGVKVLHVNKDKLNPLFTYYYLRSLDIPSAGYSRHFKFIKNKKLNFPESVTDQKRIAQVLSNCESLIEKRKESIALLDELLKSTFLEMFGDLNSNPLNYKTSTINSLCINIVDCPHSTPKYIDKITDYPCIRTSEIKNGTIDWSSMKYTNEDVYVKRIERLRPEHNDIIFAREGTVGDAAIIPENLNISLGQRVMMLRVDCSKVLPVYLWASIRSDYIQHMIMRRTIGATVKRINISEVKKIKCIVPPLELQKKFVEIVKKVDSIKQGYQTHLRELENLYGSISQKAFKGELDLSEVLLRETKYFSDSPNETPEDFKREMDALLKEKNKKSKLDENYIDEPKPKENSSDSLLKGEINNSSPLHFKIALIEHFKYNQGTYQDFITDYVSRYKNRNVWLDHEQLKIEVFKLLEGSKPKLIQYFDDNDNTVKLKLTDEAFKA